MIAAASPSAVPVLGSLLEFLVKRTSRASTAAEARKLMQLFGRLTAMTDGSGADAEKIARQVKNSQAVELISSAREKLTSLFAASAQVKKEKEDEPVAGMQAGYFCPTCGKDFRETEAQHVASIAHLLNADQPAPANRASYFLRSNNIGYQLLCKQGWNEQRGLGAQEQGKVCPVKAVVKHDRLGIGLPATSAKQPVVKKPVRLKRACQRGDAVLMRAVKAEAQRPKRIEKEKAFAKNFRLYYNQD